MVQLRINIAVLNGVRICNRRKTNSKYSKRDAGFALLVVLIALAVVSLIVASAVEAARRQRDEASAQIAQVKQRAAMDGAIATVAREFAESGAAPPDLLLHPETFEMGGISVTASVRSEASKIDVNNANSALTTRRSSAYSRRRPTMISSRSGTKPSKKLPIKFERREVSLISCKTPMSWPRQ